MKSKSGMLVLVMGLLCLAYNWPVLLTVYWVLSRKRQALGTPSAHRKGGSLPWLRCFVGVLLAISSVLLACVLILYLYAWAHRVLLWVDKK